MIVNRWYGANYGGSGRSNKPVVLCKLRRKRTICKPVVRRKLQPEADDVKTAGNGMQITAVADEIISMSSRSTTVARANHPRHTLRRQAAKVWHCRTDHHSSTPAYGAGTSYGPPNLSGRYPSTRTTAIAAWPLLRHVLHGVRSTEFVSIIL